MRRLRTGRQPVQQFQAFAFALWLDAMSENKFGPGFVHARVVLESAAIVRLVNCPASKNFGSFGNVTLRIAAVHAERVQFEQFTSVIFVQASVLLGILFGRARRITISSARPRRSAQR